MQICQKTFLSKILKKIKNTHIRSLNFALHNFNFENIGFKASYQVKEYRLNQITNTQLNRLINELFVILIIQKTIKQPLQFLLLSPVYVFNASFFNNLFLFSYGKQFRVSVTFSKYMIESPVFL